MKFPAWGLWAVALALMTWPIVLRHAEDGPFGQDFGLGFLVGGMFLGLCYELRDRKRGRVENAE